MAKEGSISNVLNKNLNYLNKLSEKLASGKRINRASDDAAGLAIMNALEASTATLSIGNRNSNDGISALSIMDGSLSQLSDISIRMQELATQSANGTLSDTQRAALNEEYQQLAQESQRIVDTTEFNGKKLITNDDIVIQSGNTSDPNSQTAIQGVDVTGTISRVATQDISTQAGAQAALEPLKTHIQEITSARGNLGAQESRILANMQNITTRIEGEEAALSRIRDVDVADAVSKMTSANIRSNAATAMYAQTSNLQKDLVAKLLG